MTGTSDDGDNQTFAPVREGELVADKYVAGPVIGKGGMGVVVAARDKLLDRKVAIKFLLPSLANSPRAVQRFIREARTATRITSEHVVRLLEIDILPNGLPFFVMEYLEGRDLRELTAERGPLPLPRAVDYLLQAMEAIAEGHLQGIVHRDIKPSNLYVTRRADGTPLIKVLDFGIAKTLEPDGADNEGLTGSDDVRLGSPSYMSPEQLRRPDEVDVRSDVWALGVTLYELVCGSSPFRGDTFADLVLTITTARPEPPSVRRPDLKFSRGLDDVVMRCLEKEKTRRFANASHVASALAPFGSDDGRDSLKRISGLRVSSAPPEYSTTLSVGGSLPAASSSRVRGRRGAMGAVAVAAVLVAVGSLAWNRRSIAPPTSTLTSTPRNAQALVQTPPESVALPVKSPAPDVAPKPRQERATVSTTVSSVRERPVGVTRSASAKRVAAPAPAASAEAADLSPAPSAQSDGARSPVIERLIENRR